jgi:hypothetical protein
MEFFANAVGSVDASTLQRTLTIETLPQYCASIDRVLRDEGEHGVIYCVWGEFPLRREVIRGGLRFSLPTCPNALAWTVTTGLAPRPEDVVIHCTINRQEHDPDFIASIEEFVLAWKAGFERRALEPVATGAA